MTSHEAGATSTEGRESHPQSGGRPQAEHQPARPSRAERKAAARAARIEAAVSARPNANRRRGAVRVVGTVLLVPALLGTVALPAYAFLPGFGGGDEHSKLFDLTSAGAQDVSVSGLATNAPSAGEDGYSVVTAEDMERARREEAAAEAARWQAEVAARAGSGSYATIGVQAEGDDYPWWNTAPDSQLSPLGYYTRECVDFVAWRLNRDRGVGAGGPYWFTNGMSGTGSAYSWADAWVRNGWPTSSEPVVGAVAWFTYNHVAYVQSIPGDGTVVIEEYNQNSDHSYHRRVIPANSVLYLYPPG